MPRLFRHRFDICVWNHGRLGLFLGNFDRIRQFDYERDRVTVVSCSPSSEEGVLIREFASHTGVPVRYLVRENRGLAELARCEYFTGEVGAKDDNLRYAYVLQMQEHYLDTESAASRWGPELQHAHKSDTVPDGVFFDFDRMEELAIEHHLHGFFADRANPCYVEVAGKRFVAPCGGNFAMRSDMIADRSAQRACRRLIRTCDDTYRWAVYAEFMWGPIFFHEGRRFWDLKRDRLYDRWVRDEFYVAPDDYPALLRRYGQPLAVQRVRRALERGRAYVGHLRRSVLRRPSDIGKRLLQ